MGLTSRSIFLEDNVSNGSVPEEAWRREYYGHYWVPAPSLAILGVGVVDSVHQLSILTSDADQKQSRRFPHIKVPENVRTSVSALDGVRGGTSEVAEIGMHLFEVHDPSRSGELGTGLSDRVAQLNHWLFSPGVTELNGVGSIYLVGGGIAKAAALRHLLDNCCEGSTGPRQFRVRLLCTDRSCANELLKGAPAARVRE